MYIRLAWVKLLPPVVDALDGVVDNWLTDWIYVKLYMNLDLNRFAIMSETSTSALKSRAGKFAQYRNPKLLSERTKLNKVQGTLQ